jgi:protocatechuate 3,4-dioxygenase beta subunit
MLGLHSNPRTTGAFMTPTRNGSSLGTRTVRSALAAATLVAVVGAARLAAAAGASAVLTPAGERGDPLVVSGTVYESDGKTPAGGTKIIVYHTDQRGYYSEGGQDRSRPKFSAELVTGADGRYSFRTLVPGYYPGGNTAKHIHYELTAKDGRTASAEMRFADDPVLSKSTLERARQAAGRGDRFFDVRPVERGKDGVKRCAFDLKLPPRPAPARRGAG